MFLADTFYSRVRIGIGLRISGKLYNNIIFLHYRFKADNLKRMICFYLKFMYSYNILLQNIFVSVNVAILKWQKHNLYLMLCFGV